MKQNQKSGITYDLYADVVTSGAVTLNPSESDAIMHRIKTQDQARKISKASLVYALQKSHKESITHCGEAATVARALESVEEKNRRFMQKNKDLADGVRAARAEARHHKSARRRSDVLAGEMQQQLNVVMESFELELGKRIDEVEADEKVSHLFSPDCSI